MVPKDTDRCYARVWPLSQVEFEHHVHTATAAGVYRSGEKSGQRTGRRRTLSTTPHPPPNPPHAHRETERERQRERYIFHRLSVHVCVDGWVQLGQTVGYRISGDSMVSGRTKLTFVTTGYLLQVGITYVHSFPMAFDEWCVCTRLSVQVLVNDPSYLRAYSHIILDEVHERDLDADLLRWAIDCV